MTKRILAVLAAITLCLGVFGTSPASAAQKIKHTGDLQVTYKCLDNGTYEGSVSLTTSAVPAGVNGTTKWRVGDENFDGTPSDANGMDRGPVASTGNTVVNLGTFTLPGDTVGKGPWVYAYSTWDDGATKGSDGQGLDDLQGDCAPVTPPPTCANTPSLCPPPVVKKASFRVVAYCNTVRVEGRHNIKSIEKVRHGDSFRFTAKAKKDAEFANGSTTKVKRVHLKRTGCGNVSGY